MTVASRTMGRFIRNTAGGIAILSATMLPVAIGALALAVDMGSLYLERRQAQSAADLAALAAAANLEEAEAAVEATLEANGIHATTALTVTRGNYVADPDVPHTTRFRAGISPTNAVEVVFTKPGRIYFANVFVARPIEMEVRAVAANSAMATFSIGSRLLALRDGLINRLLGAMLGSSINLTLMDYQALVSADVKLLGLHECARDRAQPHRRHLQRRAQCLDDGGRRIQRRRGRNRAGRQLVGRRRRCRIWPARPARQA